MARRLPTLCCWPAPSDWVASARGPRHRLASSSDLAARPSLSLQRRPSNASPSPVHSPCDNCSSFVTLPLRIFINTRPSRVNSACTTKNAIDHADLSTARAILWKQDAGDGTSYALRHDEAGMGLERGRASRLRPEDTHLHDVQLPRRSMPLLALLGDHLAESALSRFVFRKPHPPNGRCSRPHSRPLWTRSAYSSQCSEPVRECMTPHAHHLGCPAFSDPVLTFSKLTFLFSASPNHVAIFQTHFVPAH